MKEQLRRQLRQQRQLVQQQTAGPLLRAVLEVLDQQQQPGHLGIYWPLGSEPDLRSIAKQRPQWSERLALPAVQHGQLSYRPWPEAAMLQADECGVPAPLLEVALQPQQLALLLVPALAVDRQGFRLGAGGGWYDRLRSDPHWRAVPALVVLPDACLLATLPRDPWDVPFNGCITESGLHRANLNNHC